MKYKQLLWFLLLLPLLGCKKQPSAQAQPITNLSVSIEPQRYFLEQIAGNKYKVSSLIPVGANPESADLSPLSLAKVNQSFIYFGLGVLGIEKNWIANIRKTNPSIHYIDCSLGIQPIDDDDHKGQNPHIWSSPSTARILALNMRNALIETDSINAKLYTRNFDRLLQKINGTDLVIKAFLEHAPCRSFVIFHPALSYFAKEYDLEQIAIESHGKYPSPNELKTLIDRSKMEGVKVVFVQREFDTKNAETIAHAIGAKIVKINLFAYDWDTEMIHIAKVLSEN